MKAITIPAIGNHEYQNTTSTCDPGTPPGGEGHFRYFGWEIASPRNPGCVASPACTGYWSEQVGAWHVVVLNSNCSKVRGLPGGFRAGAVATAGLGGGHEPMHGRDLASPSVLLRSARRLHEHGRACGRRSKTTGRTSCLQGHDHNYERFAAEDV